MTKERNTRAGFTLLEVLIVIALLAAVAALLITNLDQILGGGKKEVAEVFVTQTLENPLMTYKIHMDQFPSTEQGLVALMKKPSDDAENWQGPYIKKLPDDPWGNPYQYAYPGTHNENSYDLWSWGPDGKESEDDIGNWESSESGSENPA